MSVMSAAGQRISPAYLALQQRLHEDPNYGVASLDFVSVIKDIMVQTKAQSLSDYGAGKCNLQRGLLAQGMTSHAYFPYDPAFPEYGPPKPADLVCCIDVLEHIEIEFLDAVLLDLKEITRKCGFFSVHCGPAVKVLADGRNAHLIQQPSSWWLPRFCQHFEIAYLDRTPGGFWVFVEARRSV
jgi:hypothetical protein